MIAEYGDDVAHFRVGCVIYDWQVLLDDKCRIVGVGEWLDEFCRVDEEGKVALLFRKGVEGICNRGMEDVEECFVSVVCGREFSCCMGRLLLDIGPPLSCYLSSSLNSWTQYKSFNRWITLYLDCH